MFVALFVLRLCHLFILGLAGSGAKVLPEDSSGTSRDGEDEGANVGPEILT